MCRLGRVETVDKARVVLARNPPYRLCVVASPVKSTVNAAAILQPSLPTHTHTYKMTGGKHQRASHLSETAALYVCSYISLYRFKHVV